MNLRFYFAVLFTWSSIHAMDEVQFRKERALAIITHKAHQELFEKLGTTTPLSDKAVSDIVTILNAKEFPAHYLLEVKYSDADYYQLEPNKKSPYHIIFLETRKYSDNSGTYHAASHLSGSESGFPLVASKDGQKDSIQFSAFYDGLYNVGWYNLLALLLQTGNIDALNTITSSTKQPLCKPLRAPISFKEFEDAIVAAHDTATKSADPAKTTALLNLFGTLSTIKPVYNFESYHNTIRKKTEPAHWTEKRLATAFSAPIALGFLTCFVALSINKPEVADASMMAAMMGTGTNGILLLPFALIHGHSMSTIEKNMQNKETHLTKNN